MAKTHNERLAEMSRYVVPDWYHDTMARRLCNPKQEKVVQRLSDESVAYLKATSLNGAGLLMDNELRYFLREYDQRIFRHGLTAFPSSFNVLESFFEFDPTHQLLKLLPEHDHLFSFTDFLDFATSADAPSLANAVESIRDGEIHSYNIFTDPHDLVFSSNSGAGEFGVGGASLVRHGDELTVLLAAGEVTDLDRMTKELSERLSDTKNIGRAVSGGRILPAEHRTTEAVALSNYADLWKVLVASRIDLRNSIEQTRVVLRDAGSSFEVFTDDERAFGSEAVSDELRDAQQRGLERYATLFEVNRQCALLPSYFAFRITMIQNEERKTGLDKPNSLTFREKERAPTSSRVYFRRVSALRIINASAERTAKRFKAPQHQVAVNGFWRHFRNPEWIGKDSEGKAVKGRTWVVPFLKYRHLPERPIEVLVKSRISIARAIAKAEPLCEAAQHSTKPAAVPQDPRSQADVTVSREEAYEQRRLLTSKLRWRILERDDFRCVLCGADAATDKSVRLDVDHIVAVSRGGKTVPENLRSLCSRCNNGKGDRI